MLDQPRFESHKVAVAYREPGRLAVAAEPLEQLAAAREAANDVVGRDAPATSPALRRPDFVDRRRAAESLNQPRSDQANHALVELDMADHGNR